MGKKIIYKFVIYSSLLFATILHIIVYDIFRFANAISKSMYKISYLPLWLIYFWFKTKDNKKTEK